MARVSEAQTQCLKNGINVDMNVPMTSRSETGTLVLQRLHGRPRVPISIGLMVFYF